MIDADRLAAKLREHGHACPGDIFTDEAGIEFLTGVKRRTLRSWRAARRGPPAVWLNRWLYDLQALVEWIASETQRHGPTHERQEPSSRDIDVRSRARSNRATEKEKRNGKNRKVSTSAARNPGARGTLV